MTRNLKLAFLAVAALAAPACIGGYAPGQDGTPPVDNSQPPANQNNGGGGGTGAGTGGNTGGGGGGGTGGGTGGSAPSSARPVFESTVATILMRCNATACHGGTGTAPTKFAVGATASALYDNILGYSSRVLGDFDKTTATIISKITPNNHNGMTYTAAEVKAIGDWLDAERTARAGTTTTSARELLLQKWSGCMVKTEFDTAGVATAWANKQTNDDPTPCVNCHINGQGFWANADSTRTFNVLTTQKNPAGGWMLEMYFTVDMTTDPANPKIIINRDFIKRAALGTAQHERFDIDTDRGGGTPSAMTRLTNFYTQTMTHLTANTCGPSRLGTTPPP